MTRSSRPRVAVVGAGRIGTVHAANLAAANADVVVVEPDPRRAAEFTETHRFPVVPSIEDASEVAGYVVCSPTDTHEPVASALLGHGVPIMIEKPCCADPVSTRALGAKAERLDVPLYIGFQRRFAVEYDALRQEVRQGRDRFTFAAFSSYDGSLPPDGYQVAGGSIAFDLQIHDIDLVLWTFDARVAEVSCTQVDLDGVPDALITTLHLTNDVACAIVSKRVSGQGCEVFAELVGTRSTLRTSNFLPLRRYADFRERFADAYAAEMRAFLDLLTGRGADDRLAAWSDAAAAEEVCQEIDLSLRRDEAPLVMKHA